MSRMCECGGVIREVGKPFWDILPSCTCERPRMVHIEVKTTATTDGIEIKDM